jgi:hypothetical protein
MADKTAAWSAAEMAAG